MCVEHARQIRLVAGGCESAKQCARNIHYLARASKRRGATEAIAKNNARTGDAVTVGREAMRRMAIPQQ